MSSFSSLGDTEEDALTLYLISRLLRGNPKLAKTYAALREDIQTHELLGHTHNWQHTLRTRTLEDMDDKNYRMPSSQLQLHLRASSTNVLKSNPMNKVLSFPVRREVIADF